MNSERRHVLAITAEPKLSRALTDALRRAGFEATVATHLHEALTLAARIRPDAVVCDVDLPDRHGVDLIRRIRREHGDVPFIVLHPSEARSAFAGVIQDLQLMFAKELAAPALSPTVPLAHSLGEGGDPGLSPAPATPPPVSEASTTAMTEVSSEGAGGAALATTPSVAVAPPAPTSPFGGSALPKPVRIALVDEPGPLETTVRQAAVRAFGVTGAVVTRFEGALGALRAFAQEPPHILLFEIALPDIDGVTFMRLLRRAPRLADVRAVVATKHPHWHTLTVILDAGADAYVFKPVDPEVLARTMSDLMARKVRA